MLTNIIAGYSRDLLASLYYYSLISLQVCEQLGVPLNVVSLTEQYWDRVVAHSIDEIRLGRTPNPDVLCNSRLTYQD